MKCPYCNLELNKEFYEGVIVFRCPGCAGRMVTVSGLRNLSGNHAVIDQLWRMARAVQSNDGPFCGACRKPMRRVLLSLTKEQRLLELDVCGSCQMVWFDAHELEQIPRRLPARKLEDELPPKAREILAMHEIRRAEERINQSAGGIGDAGGENAPDEGWKQLLAFLGFPVELNAPECRRKPVVTWAIALICVLVFIATFSHSEEAAQEWGFIPEEWTRMGGLTLLTSMFLHGGIFHLIGNLYFLLIFGDNVEDEFGWKKYILLLLASGLCASGLHALFDPRATIPCIGASGFISGVIACYAICFPRVRLSFMLGYGGLLSLMRRYWMSLPAWGAFVIWIGLQFVMALLTRRVAGEGGVAYLAHVGGALPGIVYAFYYRTRSRGGNFESDASSPSEW